MSKRRFAGDGNEEDGIAGVESRRLSSEVITSAQSTE